MGGGKGGDGRGRDTAVRKAKKGMVRVEREGILNGDLRGNVIEVGGLNAVQNYVQTSGIYTFVRFRRPVAFTLRSSS